MNTIPATRGSVTERSGDVEERFSARILPIEREGSAAGKPGCPGITFEQYEAAYHELIGDDGRPLSQRQIRRYLRSGSNSTLSSYRRRIAEQRLADQQPPEPHSLDFVLDWLQKVDLRHRVQTEPKHLRGQGEVIDEVLLASCHAIWPRADECDLVSPSVIPFARDVAWTVPDSHRMWSGIGDACHLSAR